MPPEKNPANEGQNVERHDLSEALTKLVDLAKSLKEYEPELQDPASRKQIESFLLNLPEEDQRAVNMMQDRLQGILGDQNAD